MVHSAGNPDKTTHIPALELIPDDVDILADRFFNRVSLR